MDNSLRYWLFSELINPVVIITEDNSGSNARPVKKVALSRNDPSELKEDYICLASILYINTESISRNDNIVFTG